MNNEIVKVGKEGRIVIPAKIRKLLDIKEGDILTVTVVNGEVVVKHYE